MVVKKILWNVLRWIAFYCAGILLIQLCNPWIVAVAKFFQDSFNSDLLLNWIAWLFICLLVGIYCYTNRILNLKVVSLILAVYSTFRFYDKLHLEWAFMKYESIYYCDILVGAFFLSVLIDGIVKLFHLIRGRNKGGEKRDDDIDNQESKFAASYSESSITRKEDDRFRFYEEAKLFLDKLVEQKKTYKDNALIVGLEGEWGSGKSSFINMIECAISNYNKSSQFKLVKFSSWNYRNSNQLTVELLSVISESIGEKEIRKAIDKYIKVFEGTSLQWLAVLTKAFCGGDKTTQEYFNDVNEKLKFRNQTLIVAVDDIDRLVKEEVIEVLKLVRNTANFRNIVYVVAYDRSYVEEALKECGISNSEKYLEKIFNVPFLLPEKSIEQRKELYKEILQKNILFNKTDKIDNGIVAFVDEFGEYLSIRNVKKLAKQLLINTPFIREDGLTFELDIYDTLILYYLGIKYKPIYENLKSFYCDVRNLEQYKREIIYCDYGIIKKNMIGDSKEYENEDFYIEKRIFPILKRKHDSTIASKFITSLFAVNNKGYDKTAYCMYNPDVYPIFFTKKIPENFVKIKDFIDESKKVSFSDKLKEWDENKNRSMLGWIISCIRYDNYSKDEFINMFKTIISTITIKGCWTRFSVNPPQSKAFIVIPGIDCRFNRKSEIYKTAVKYVIEDFVYDEYFSQRFSLLIQEDTFEYIYNKVHHNYISTCEKYLDVYLAHESKFDEFNYDFWEIINYLYEYTHEDEVVRGMQEKCKSHILKNIRSFAENWNNNKNNDYLSCVFSPNLVAITHNSSGGWRKYFFEFIKANEDEIGNDIAILFYNNLPE